MSCAFQEYINQACVAEVGGLITGKLTPTLAMNMKTILKKGTICTKPLFS
jgi:hypothetical protein